MRKHTTISLLLCASLMLTGCSAGKMEAAAATVQIVETAANTVQSAPQQTEDTSVFSSRDLDASYSEADCIPIVLGGDKITCDDTGVEITGTTATIRNAGTYLISGTLEDGSVIVDADKADKIQLVLKGVSIHSETFAPIYVRQADKVFITLAAGTENSLSGGTSFSPDGEVNVDSVIFSREDLTLNGSGALEVTSLGGHGIVSKDSLRITGGTYEIEASAHGLCGKDEVSIADGSFAITAGKDGIHAENSEDPEGGTLYLAGGTYRITAEGDGISASGSCRILAGDYTLTTGGGSASAPQHTSDRGFGGQKGGNRPTDAGFVQQAGSAPERGMTGKGGMGGNRIPQQTIEPATEETQPPSTKGIRAAELTIEGGAFTIDSADDCLHSDGDFTIRDGSFTIASGDDGIHGDGTVTMVSGSVNITQSYEGIEGLHVQIQGGAVVLTATDDGLNAAGGMDSSGFGGRGDTFTQSGDTPSVVISGGTVSVTASGDGIDANGTVEITGGTVTVSGPVQGDTAILDYDLSGVISGGTFIGTGASAMAQTFRDSSQGVISVNAGTQSAGTNITLTDSSGKLLLTHTPPLSYEVVVLSTPEIRAGESYTLTIGSTSQAFTAK